MAAPSNKPKKNRKAPGLDETATAIQTTSRGARESAGGKPMHFNVDPEFFQEFKTFAAMNNLSMKDLLINSFTEYKRKHS